MKEQMKRDAVDFLLYTYFKIDTQSLTKTGMISKAVKVAYKDATGQRAYNFDFGKELKEEPKKQKNSNGIENRSSQAHSVCESYLIKAVVHLLDAGDQVEYDKRHKRICHYIVKKYQSENKIPFFTYGNAQKWINMTMKYLYVLSGALDTYIDRKRIKEFCDLIAEKAYLFHVPIDSYIIKALYENTDMKCYIYSDDKIAYKIIDNVSAAETDDVFDRGNETQMYKLVPKRTKGLNMTAWSKIESYNLYRTIVLKMREVLKNEIPLEWEMRNWINVAMRT